ncbi:hypothetical protein Y032_0175g508 [Ancylostoma ceylanicum]|uniref:Uncharacterized protein n=1 Tax=Ancylostoma ceylanicum TaxID=53326 RepID=A0A016SUQ5_9BILA|nr:hypothetical protein Y032_0175g508 [Ancylostoma ceylanicum]
MIFFCTQLSIRVTGSVTHDHLPLSVGSATTLVNPEYFWRKHSLLLPNQVEQRRDDSSVKLKTCSVQFAPPRMLHDRNPVLRTNSSITPIRFWWIAVTNYVLEQIKYYIIHKFGLVA